MNGRTYRQAIERLGMSPTEAADFLGVNETTARRWQSDRHSIPYSVEMLLHVMIAKQLTPNSVAAMITKKQEAA